MSRNGRNKLHYQLVEYNRRQDLINKDLDKIRQLKQQLKQENSNNWAVTNKLELQINSLEIRIKRNAEQNGCYNLIK